MDRRQKTKVQTKVTSYSDFVNQFKVQKAKPMPIQVKPHRKKERLAQNSDLLNRPEHFVSRQSNAHTFVSNAHISTHNDLDLDCTPRHANKQNTFIQPRSCSKSKHNKSYDSYLKTESDLPKRSEEVTNYLLNELLLIVQSMTKFNRQRIPYLDFLEILRQFNMIQNNYQPCKDDIVFRLWEQLIAGNKQNVTCLINLAIILLAVMKVNPKTKFIKDFFSGVCYSVDEIRSHNQQRKGQVQSGFKKNKEGYFELSAADVNEIYKQFKELRVTRMFLGRINKKSQMIEERKERFQNHSFRPYVSSKSKSLAKNKKQKSHQQSIEPNQSVFQCLSERQKKQFSQCTFQPKTSRNAESKPLQPSLGIKRSQLLFEISKSKQRRDRRPDEAEYEKFQSTYTFKPDLTISSRRSLEKIVKVQGQTKEVTRMLKARLQKQVRTKASEKGIPYNEREFTKIRRKITQELCQQVLSKKISDRIYEQFNKIEEYSQVTPLETQTAEQEEPKAESPIDRVKDILVEQPKKELFTFEVYLDQNVCLDKITLYEGQSPEEVAAAFVSKHNLKPEMETKLINSLYSHMVQIAQRNQLCKIDEEDIEYSLDF